jgi:hypothetical protein
MNIGINKEQEGYRIIAQNTTRVSEIKYHRNEDYRATGVHAMNWDALIMGSDGARKNLVPWDVWVLL